MAMNACVMYRCRKERNQRWDGKRIWMPWQEVYDFIHRCLTGYYAAWVLRSEGLAAI